jgi:hypothetical protein
MQDRAQLARRRLREPHDAKAEAAGRLAHGAEQGPEGRRRVAVREHDGTAAQRERREAACEFLLRRYQAGQHVQVVHEQRVEGRVPLAEPVLPFRGR